MEEIRSTSIQITKQNKKNQQYKSSTNLSNDISAYVKKYIGLKEPLGYTLVRLFIYYKFYVYFVYLGCKKF